MIKLVCFFRRKVGMSREDFHAHWLSSHGPLIRDTPDLASGDIVKFHFPGSPPISGVTSIFFPETSDLPNTLVGFVPNISPGSYLISVLSSNSELKLGPLNFVVLARVPGGEVPPPPPCAPGRG